MQLFITDQMRNQIQQQITAQVQNGINNNNNENRAAINEQPEDINNEIQTDLPPVNGDENDQNRLNDDETRELRQSLTDAYANSILTPFENRYNIQKPNKKIEKTLEKAITKINKVLEDSPLLTDKIDVTNLNHLVYAAAITAIKTACLEKECLSRNLHKSTAKKKDWTFDMNRRINDLRTDISRISQMNDPNPSTKMKRNTNNMRNKYKIYDEENRVIMLETLKQRLSVLNNRLSRYQKRQKQYHQNKTFAEKPSKLYDQLRGNRINITEPPQKEDIERFWKPLYENEKEFNKNAIWLNDYKSSLDTITPAEFNDIEPKEITNSSSKFSNWKSPGIDKLQNFWWNKLTSLHPKIANVMNGIVNNPEECPAWLTTGRTTLIPKKSETRNPSNYRPITCLPIIYKILTSVITSRMNHHIQAFNIIPAEQKGNASNTFGTIDQLSINKMIMEEAKKKKRNISTAWIDYQKAYDSVPHDWIIETLKIHKFDSITIKFFEKTMINWQTSLHLNHDCGSIETDQFSINTGIFQGDSCSGTFFILSLLPLSWLLKQSNLGYRINNMNDVISHLLFMDDLKLYASNDQQLESQIKIVKTFSDDIRMNFGINKCNKVTIKRGNITKTNDVVMDNGDILKTLDQNKQYRYLGINEHQTTDKTTKSSLKNEYFKRVKMILKSELNSMNTISAINSYAVPALSYGFAVLDWNITELEIVDRETRKLLQRYHLMHSQSDITRLYLPRKDGGRGLLNISDQYQNTIINFSSYLLNTEEPLLTLTSNWQLSNGEKSLHRKASRYCRQLGLEIETIATKPKSQRKNEIKTTRVRQQQQMLTNKQLHGQFMHQLNEPHVDKEASIKWMKSSTLKRATESTICAIQEQAITTRYIQRNVFHQQVDDTCRVCRSEKETIHHVVSGCSTLAPTKYLQRHDNVCKYIHSLLLNEYRFIDRKVLWYQHQPKTVEENQHAKILWNFSVQTDHTINHNKPDIIVVDKATNTANIIDVAIPNDYNITRKRLDKIRAYTDLAVEIKTLWNLQKVNIIPVIIGATGTFYKNFEKDIEKLCLKNNKFDMRETQKITLLGTAHIVRSFLQIA